MRRADCGWKTVILARVRDACREEHEEHANDRKRNTPRL
jgi:hypothetical protein